MKTPLELPSQKYLRDRLAYDPETGKLFWKVRPLSDFAKSQKPVHAAATWNARYAGKEAFTNETNLYRRGSLDNVVYGAHRVIWKWMTDEEPPEIDHINGVRSDNRFANLRAATHLTNHKNHCCRSNNRSGVNGVFFERRSGKWRAAIGIGGGKARHIGLFETIEAATAARKAAERRLGYHPNHGRAA